MSNDSNPNNQVTANQSLHRDTRRCPKCEMFLPIDRSKIAVGDQVSFMASSSRGRSVKFSGKKGVVEAIQPDDVILIKYRGEIYTRAREDVSPADAPTPLTMAFIGVCQCNAPADPEAQS